MPLHLSSTFVHIAEVIRRVRQAHCMLHLIQGQRQSSQSLCKVEAASAAAVHGTELQQPSNHVCASCLHWMSKIDTAREHLPLTCQLEVSQCARLGQRWQ